MYSLVHAAQGFRDGSGRTLWSKSNEASVTPLLPLLVDESFSVGMR